MTEQTSSIIETQDNTIDKQEISVSSESSNGSYTLLLAFIVICLVLFLMYHAYSCFCINQETEPYINEQPRSDVQADKEFDVDIEVKKLTDLQEEYLEKLQRSRTGNG